MNHDKFIQKIYSKHRIYLRYAEKLLPIYSSIKPEDIVQDMYVKLIEKLKDNSLTEEKVTKNNEQKYICTIIKNLILDHIKKNKKEIPTVTINNSNSINKTEDNSNSHQQYLDDLQNAIETFDEVQKRIFNIYLNKKIWIGENLFNNGKKIGVNWSLKKNSIRNMHKATTVSYRTLKLRIARGKKEIKKYINGKKEKI